MAYEVGNCKPPVHTRFQKGHSGNPGGRPGPRRAMERRVHPYLQAMLFASPEDVAARTPRDAFESMAKDLAVAAMAGNVPAVRLVFSLVGRRIRKRAVRMAAEEYGEFLNLATSPEASSAETVPEERGSAL